jgi:peptide subunit release factor 1 (eRF1)
MASTITNELAKTELATGPLAVSIEEPLARLVSFEPTTFPVLSVYLNTQPDQHGRTPDAAPYLQREFKALARTWVASSPARESFDRDVERIIAYATEKIDHAANGVALFACWGAGEFFEAVQLTTPLSDNHVYAYNQPHLYHLAHLDEQYPRYAAVLTDTNTARIFVFGMGHVISAEAVKGKKVHRVKVGGWSQARYQRRCGNAHQEHAKEVIERLAEIVRDDKVSHIILAGDSVVIPLLQEQIPQEMAAMVEVMKLDIHASDNDVLRATLEKLQEQEAKTAAEKVDRLMQQYRAHGLAIVGLEETLEALANGQVDELLISGKLEESHPETEQVTAILAPEIPDSDGGTNSDEPRQASVPDLLVTKAKQTGATVTFIEDPALLEPIGGVGAFLRWRT